MGADIAADEDEHDVVADGELAAVEPDADIADTGELFRCLNGCGF